MTARTATLGALMVLLLAGSGAWIVLRPNPGLPEARLPIPPLPPRVAGSGRYQACLDMVNTDPEGAADTAEAWRAAGGGAPAAHCLGLARMALGEPEDAANLLQGAAEDTGLPASGRAAAYGQAARAWMMAGDNGRAFAADTLALSLAPDDTDLLVDHAVAAAALKDFDTAVADLSRALRLDPQRTDALTLRGSAYRHLGDLARAQDDIDRAIALEPDDAEALLERGILRQRRNDRQGARQDWERAIAVAPDSPTADLAQQNLALLEAGPSR